MFLLIRIGLTINNEETEQIFTSCQQAIHAKKGMLLYLLYNNEECHHKFISHFVTFSLNRTSIPNFICNFAAELKQSHLILH